jgi:hypothetical protein
LRESVRDIAFTENTTGESFTADFALIGLLPKKEVSRRRDLFGEL